MSDVQDRIEQFRKMAEADPSNELGHFSLGRAYLDAGRPAEAVGPLRRVIVELNPNISKAYQLIGQSLLATGDRVGAIAALTEGVKKAAARGDMMPKNEMSTAPARPRRGSPRRGRVRPSGGGGGGRRRRRRSAVQAVRPGRPQAAGPAVSQRFRPRDFREHLRSLLAGRPGPGDEGHQRTSFAPERSAGAESLGPAHPRVFAPARLTFRNTL